jgi:hypothetical protein
VLSGPEYSFHVPVPVPVDAATTFNYIVSGSSYYRFPYPIPHANSSAPLAIATNPKLAVDSMWLLFYCLVCNNDDNNNNKMEGSFNKVAYISMVQSPYTIPGPCKLLSVASVVSLPPHKFVCPSFCITDRKR